MNPAIYYIRNDHTTVELSKDYKEAKKQLVREFDCGNSFGMFYCDGCPNHIHAKGDYMTHPFLYEVESFYKMYHLKWGSEK